MSKEQRCFGLFGLFSSRRPLTPLDLADGYAWSLVMAAQEEVTQELQSILKDLEDAATLPKLSLTQLQLLASSIKSDKSTFKGLSVLCLSSFARKTYSVSASTEGADKHVYDTFAHYVRLTLAPEVPTEDHNPETCVPLALLLANLFPFAPHAAVKLLTSSLRDDPNPSVDPLGVLLEVADLSCSLQPALSELLNQAAGTKQGRRLVRDRALEWLQGAVNLRNGGEKLSMLCAVALSKLDMGHNELEDGQQIVTDTRQEQIMMDAGLCNRMLKQIITHTNDPEGCSTAIEGIAVLSTKSHVKEIICQTPNALSSILALSPMLGPRPSSLPQTPRASVDFDDSPLAPVQAALCFGVTTIMVHLTAQQPVASGEEEQIARLRKMAISGKKAGAAEIEEDPFETFEAVRNRIEAVTKAGVVSALSGLIRAQSRGVMVILGRLCLQLVDDKTDRLRFIRDGGYKVLGKIVRELMAPAKGKRNVSLTSSANAGDDEPNTDALYAIQALAKLVITTSPQLLFPPPSTTTCLNALTPLYLLLLRPSSSLLQTFESLMALTNIASIDPAIASRICLASHAAPRTDTMRQGAGRDNSDTIFIMQKVEELLLSDNRLIGRAACELLCNLAGSPEGFAYLSGERSTAIGSKSTSKYARSQARSRLQILLILMNAEDLSTQLAAGGALAILTESDIACEILLSLDSAENGVQKRSTWTRIVNIIQPEVEDQEDGERIPVISSGGVDTGLILRMVIITLNLLTHASKAESGVAVELDRAKGAGLAETLRKLLIPSMSPDVRGPAEEALELLSR